jgi:hypothetical protein
MRRAKLHLFLAGYAVFKVFKRLELAAIWDCIDEGLSKRVDVGEDLRLYQFS